MVAISIIAIVVHKIHLLIVYIYIFFELYLDTIDKNYRVLFRFIFFVLKYMIINYQ
jgi:hypothetical protein